QYNAINQPIVSIERAFQVDGELPIAAIHEEDVQDFKTLSFTLRGKDGIQEIYRKFDVGVPYDFKFPSKIPNARIIFLGSQLIVADKSTKSYYNFIVPTSKKPAENLFPDYPPILSQTIGIESITADKLSNKDKCRCGCIKCGTATTPCTTLKCSCKCGDEACSRTCATDYEAVCEKDCSGKG
ncbi:MAG: hypothetical protein AAF597_08565, partial [Bacteroidota bacterium]